MDNFSKESILIIFEEDLKDRFNHFIDKTNIEVINLDLKNVFSKNILLTIFLRIIYRRKILNAKKIILTRCKGKKFIFVSNSEGFIALSLIESLKENLEAKIISLQHGIFELINWPKYKVLIKSLINYLGKKFFNISLIGQGFGKKITDKYIVYCQEYKDFLILNGWKENDIIISSYFLKNKTSDIKDIYYENEKLDQNVLLIAQPLSASGMITEEIEGMLYKKLLNALTIKYEKIFLRQHPFEKVYFKNKPENVIETNETSLIDDLNKADTVVSFMSTVLVDYEEMNKEFIAVYSKHLSFYKSSYIAFRKIYNIDEDKDLRFNPQINPKRKRDFFYQKGVFTLEDLSNEISI